MALSFRCGTNHLCDIYLTKAAQTEKIIFEKRKGKKQGTERKSHQVTIKHCHMSVLPDIESEKTPEEKNNSTYQSVSEQRGINKMSL